MYFNTINRKKHKEVVVKELQAMNLGKCGGGSV